MQIVPEIWNLELLLYIGIWEAWLQLADTKLLQIFVRARLVFPPNLSILLSSEFWDETNTAIFPQEAKGLSLAGFISWFIWRSAYLTRVISWRNRLYVAINWATTFVFGRDISRIQNIQKGNADISFFFFFKKRKGNADMHNNNCFSFPFSLTSSIEMYQDGFMLPMFTE